MAGRRRRAKKAARSRPVDRISDLPDGVLEHILGFLPAHEAVQTSVLAPRWRHLWRSTRRLHITQSKDRWHPNDFVYPLLLLRDRSSALDEVSFDYDTTPTEEHIDIWIRHALMLQARVVIVNISGEFSVTLQGPPLKSQHLRRLQLALVDIEDDFLDFARCSALEILEMKVCGIYSERIVSPSLRHLHIEDSTIFSDVRTRISAPRLISLRIQNVGGKAPFLGPMPSLETAYLEPAYKGEDYCDKGDYQECCGVCEDCCDDDGQRFGRVLLGGVSNATSLELLSYPGTVIFRRDLKWCPTFSKLKKLLLNNWCAAIDFRGLVCILEQSPVLEDLTLKLYKGPMYMVEKEDNYSKIGKSTRISKHLKLIKVNCEKVDERIYKILKFLSMLDIEITIKRTPYG